MATKIITLAALKTIFKKFQEIIFNKYDDKIAEIELKNTDQDDSISTLESNLQNEITRATDKENELSDKCDTKVDILSLSTDTSIATNSYKAVLIIAASALTLTYPNTSGTSTTQVLTAGSMTILAKSGSGYTNSIFGAVYN